LKPPFTGNDFPSLKRAVVAGRYQPIPRKYSDGLHRVIAVMLRVNARERPSAEAILRSADVTPKLHLDEIVVSQAANQPAAREQAFMELMETIKVPQNLRKLNAGLLPKPCYPDVRPNSPTAWTVAEQAQQIKRRPAPAAVAAVMPSVPSASDSENVPPSRDDGTSVPAVQHSLAPMAKAAAAAAAPSAAALAEYYSRRPLAPSNAAPAPAAYAYGQGGYAIYKQQEVSPRYGAVEPLAPMGGAAAPRPKGYAPAPPPAGPRVAGHPVRIQYQHRAW